MLIVPKNPTFAEKLGTGLGMGLGAGAESASANFAKQMEKNKISKSLQSQGLSPADAELYMELTKGGQTAFAKDILENRKRGMDQSPKRSEESRDMTDKDMEEIIAKQDEGLLPSEKVKRGKERYETGLKPFQEAGSKLRGITREKQNIDILESLDKTGKLPKDFGRLNVDESGNLKLPFAASPEAQRFVKTINEFSQSAKETYGSRVTNYDLSQFMRRFPTLLNSADGRKQLYQQMKIISDINSVYYKNLKNVYEKAGGVRNIDTDLAEALAEKASAPQVDKLAKKFETIGEINTLPNPSEFKGRKIQDEKTGEIFVSDGNEWVPEG